MYGVEIGIVYFIITKIIYLWKGKESSVRETFIGSRRVQEL